MPADDTSANQVAAALDRLIERYRERCGALEAEYDPEWRSPCELADDAAAASGRVRWEPLRRPVEVDLFAGLERALEAPIHPAIKTYYGRYWSGHLETRAPDGHVSLLQIWNEADADRLIENLIGHALAKRRARAPFTVFFACTEPDSELFLSVDNETGEVLLEEPGRKPLRVVAASLAEFLDTLTPAVADADGV